MDFSNFTLVTHPKVDSNWLRADYLGALKVRSSIGRNSYRIKPGLYRLGKPGKDSEVLVTSNYKLSFDILRRSLRGVDAWILVLQTYGINVWCAAGKGTFGTKELIRQINETRLMDHVKHKRLIVPQLGATGVSGFKVKEATGFHIKFGPVRAGDLKEYLSNGYKKDTSMRSVRFNLMDRLILTPVEIMNSLLYLLLILVAMVLLSGIHSGGYSFPELWSEGAPNMLFLLLAYFSGAFLGPVLLPWLPFRQFGGKGMVIGLLTSGLVLAAGFSNYSFSYATGWLLMSGAISSFLTMNFTGASTYTSLSGVKKEMRLFVPVQLVVVVCGFVLFIISQFD